MIPVSQVSNNYSFYVAITRLNQIATIISTNTVTADSTVGGSITTGNSQFNGYFGALNLFANNLSGGSLGLPGLLSVISNTSFLANNIVVLSNGTISNTTFSLTSLTSTSTTNTNFTSNNFNVNGLYSINLTGTLNTTGLLTQVGDVYLNSNSTNLVLRTQGTAVLVNSSNTYFNVASFSVTGNTAMVGTLTVSSNTVLQNVYSQNILQSNITHTQSTLYNATNTSTQIIDSFAISTYRSADYIIQVSDPTTNNHQLSRATIVHDGATPYFTEYGRVISNTTLGVLYADLNSNTSSIELLFLPATSSSTIKIQRTALLL